MTIKGLFGRFCGQFKGLFGQCKGPFGAVVWAVLWAFYMSHFSLRVKVVIT